MSRFGPRPEKPKRAFRDTWREAAVNIAKAFDLVWKAHAMAALSMGLITLLSAFLPAGQAWVGKLIVDAVVNASRSGATSPDFWIALQPVLPYLAVELLLITGSSILSQARTLVEHVLHARLANQINTAIIRKALSMDLQFFENAEFYDKLENARREADYRALNILNGVTLSVQNVITLLSFAVLLFSFSPLIALILFTTSLPAFIAQNHFGEINFRLLSWRAPERRQMNYWESLLTKDASVKEVKLFGLGEPLLKRYLDLFWKAYREDTAVAKKRSLISLGLGLISSLAYYGAYAWIVWRAIGQTITLGDMTLYLALFRQSQGTLQGLFYNISGLYESSLFMSNLFSFLSIAPSMSGAGIGKKVPHPIRQGIEFRNVSFKYPNRDGYALRNVSLMIQPGEKLALVGANGAGKTTFVKLLTRLYDPTEGQILLDGIDLREIDADDLRLSIGVIFQDFVKYLATARENIGFGQINALDDLPRVERAAERGGADTVVAELPKGYETVLGNWWERSSDLSGGQWQKMALSRAFMREGEILVLDEPTAALDAEREYEIFQRFRDLTAGKISLLISHRFSTVRMADRIAVLENGALTELGTHPELLARAGTYARLFNMQAEGYR